MPVQIPNYTSPYALGMSGTTGPGTTSRAAASSAGSTTGPSAGGRTTSAGSKSGPGGADSQDKTDTSGTDGSSGTGNVIDAVFGDADDKMVSMEDFLTLMVAQLKNQDFMNPVDDTQYVTQLAQISSMQQMEQMAYNAKSTYVTSLVGKYVSAAKFTVSGELKKSEGLVDKVSLLDEKFVIYVDGEAYDMDEIMEIKTPPVTTTPNEDHKDDKDPGDDGDSGNQGDGSGKV
ncbi:flagellar hook assembly protein FlgD [Enterocloster aldenensis]|uniref:flagellar hook assembly protein FlgD n=1 Tax=Enterocloster aldenensis TaxID=358742 RepID=UPI000E5387BF|nr:flagellar hook capping protein [Enterocloster aldenensis]